MEKVVLVDGNNLLFRAYYATAYSGNMMKNSKGMSTNGVYGFLNMINKIIKEEKPKYMLVAFDKGKTFRHEQYAGYKDGRSETPDELKEQFPIAKDLLNALGIMNFEIDNYEADDIIGTLARQVDENAGFIGTIVSSDKDLLQLITDDVTVKLLKTKASKIMTPKTFKEDFELDPIKIIDLKSLEGDASDNIPGVKGVGAKTALKLLHEYDSLDGIYQNIHNIKGKLQEKLINDKENAYMSRELATIITNVPLEFDIKDTEIKEDNKSALISIYENLEFYSQLKSVESEKVEENFDIHIVNEKIEYKSDVAVFLETKKDYYHNTEIVGLGLYDGEKGYYYTFDELVKNNDFLKNNNLITYDMKKLYAALKWKDIKVENVSLDIMLAAYLLNYNIKDDIAYIAKQLGYDVPFQTSYRKKELSNEEMSKIVCLKAKFLYEHSNNFIDDMKREDVFDLYTNIEQPLTTVLADMELEGIRVNDKYLKAMGVEITGRIGEIEKEVYKLVGREFNIASPKQLGDILFDELKLPHGKKTKTGYSTSRDVLDRLANEHEIINLVIEFRTLAKLYSTYIEGLISSIHEDGKIHTIYNQALARTGRLSSTDPNLQNIPIRYEYGRLIRKAFKPETGALLMSSDYSQVELRIMAHISQAENLLEAFNSDIDIHTKTASDIFEVPLEEVSKAQRSNAKAVNFGILYGISGFGLAEGTGLKVKEAESFINKYLEAFPGVKNYMDQTIKDAYKNGFVETIMKRKRIIDELSNKNYMIRKQGERIALNTPIQGSSADILKKAMIEIHAELKKKNLKSKMLLQVHDELILNCYKDEKDEVYKLVTSIMENTIKLDVPLKVDTDFGEDWYQAK